MIEKLKSRKLGATVAGGVIIIAGSHLGVPHAVLETVAELFMTYLGAQGLGDLAATLKAKKHGESVNATSSSQV